MSDTEDDDLRAVHEGFVTVTEWLLHWAREGFIYHPSGSVVLTNGVRSDLKALASELEWITKMIPVDTEGKQ
jgi:hypothetical protein